MKGFFGKYLDINLTTEEINEYKINENWLEKHIGGRGIATRILLEEMNGGEDPLGPDNIMIFATGPFQGTGIPGAGRHAVLAKSPKTGTINESYSGGFFAHELGTSGYDGIIIRGKAKTPKYITLINGKAQIWDAQDLWCFTVPDTEKELKRRCKGVRVSSIGPAGENLVKCSCIINDFNRAIGRPGFGAVMGSKNLKAVAIKGGVKKQYYDENKLKSLKKKFAKDLVNDPTMNNLGQYGTVSGIEALNHLGILPTKNFQEGFFKGYKNIDHESYQRILVNRDNCTACPVRCKRVVRTKFNGEKVEDIFGGPEYETVAAFGSLCLNDNLDSIALANKKCNEYGLDTISVGNIIAFVMEATEKHLIKEEEGVKWGDSKGIIKIIDKIVKKEGIGKLLAKGIDFAASELGADFAVHIKGQEVPLHEPRGKKGLAISYATSPRGATHLEAMHDEMFGGIESPTPELGITQPFDRLEWKNKAELCKKYEDLYSFVNSLIICGFVSWNRVMRKEYYPFPIIRELLNAVTGLEIDADEMMKIGERNYVIRKILSAKDGYSRRDDVLPKRLREPLKKGVCEGEDIPEELLSKAIDEYYLLRGFNDYGPTNEKLKELGLINILK